MNLICAEGLPGSEDLEVNSSLAKPEEMAARVRAKTERHHYRFQRNTAEFENSEGYFRMIMPAVVLVEDFQAQYAPNKIGSAADAWFGDGFFANARDVFLHGLTDENLRGTCSSLPVLQVAVARRLGYAPHSCRACAPKSGASIAPLKCSLKLTATRGAGGTLR